MVDPVAPVAPSIPDTAAQPQDPPQVPVAALQAERQQRQAAEAELKKLRDAQAAAEREAAEKRGEHERLWKEAEARAEAATKERDELKERVSLYTASRRKAIKARVEALPEHLRDLVPDDLGDLDLAERLTTKAEQISRQAPAPPLPPGSPARAPVGGGDADALTAEETAWAASKGYDGKADPGVIKAAFARLHPPKK